MKENEPFLLLGETYLLRMVPSSHKKMHAVFGGENLLLLHVPHCLPVDTLVTEGKKTVEHAYKDMAKTYFQKRLGEINDDHYGFRYRSVRIKDQSTRFGSCSSKGNLNFNWRVIMAPREIVDYLLIHELCHLKEMNHSPRFWDLVSRSAPDYKKSKAWLRKNGGTLLI